MKKLCVVFIFSILCLLLFSTIAHPYSGAKAVCLTANPVPNIDGVINENEWGEGIYLDKSVTLKGEKKYNGFGNCYQPDFIKDEKDCSGTLYFLWDKTNLYLAAKITDDDIYLEAESVWQNDCTEWRFNPDGQADDSYIGMWITPKFKGGKPGWMITNPGAEIKDEVNELPTLKAVIRNNGYEWELRIPNSEGVMNDIDLKAGNIIGFTISIGENDAKGAEYSMPCWSLNPAQWGWNEVFWGEIEFSGKPLTVDYKGKLAATWGSIKIGI